MLICDLRLIVCAKQALALLLWIYQSVFILQLIFELQGFSRAQFQRDTTEDGRVLRAKLINLHKTAVHNK